MADRKPERCLLPVVSFIANGVVLQASGGRGYQPGPGLQALPTNRIGTSFRSHTMADTDSRTVGHPDPHAGNASRTLRVTLRARSLMKP